MPACRSCHGAAARRAGGVLRLGLGPPGAPALLAGFASDGALRDGAFAADCEQFGGQLARWRELLAVSGLRVFGRYGDAPCGEDVGGRGAAMVLQAVA